MRARRDHRRRVRPGAAAATGPARTAQQSNDYWLYNVLFGADQFPQVLDNARTLVADMEAQTLASVQALAATYLDPARALPVLVVPES